MVDSSNDRMPGEPERLSTLTELNSASTSNRRARPPMVNLSTGDIASRVPLRQPNIQRKDSKGGLRAMFTRNKAEKEKGLVSPVVEEAPLSRFSERSMRAVAEASLPRSISIKKSKTKIESELSLSTPHLPITPAKPTAKVSRMNLRARSVKEKKTPSKPSPKSSRSSTKSSTRPPTRTSAAWDPPPLFQAYPQAIKHAQLSASTLSADAILRRSNHKRNNSLRDEFAQTQDGEEMSAAAKKSEKAKSKHRRQISSSLSKADWTQKIFVLVTSGYLLQYSGDGSFDRLPEKMMQLGKDSVAFASDVIPGKHWVLQISQAMDSDGTPASDSRSLLSRLAFRGADYRRAATSLLLVLDSAEDMDSWIAVVRREIEALGGKKHVSETGKPKPDDKVMQLKAQPSHRYLVQRHPDQRSDPPSPHLPSFGPPPWVKEKDNELQQKLEEAASILIQPQSSSMRPSTGHHSITGSITSNDGRQLESLRDSTNRFSYVSSGQRTLVTSQGSTPATSPTRESASFEDMLPKVSIEESHLKPNAAALNERRRSIQTMHIPVPEPQAIAKPQRHSTYGGPTASLARSRSQGLTPNFSVPNSSIKRYCVAKTPVQNIPPVSTTTTRPLDSVLKGTRKAPPTALHVARPLSPVKDSPKKASIIVTPGSTAFSMVHAKPSVITIPPRSPSTPSLEPAAVPLKRMSSLIPLNAPEISMLDFHFPRRYSSMQTLRETGEKQDHADAPLRPAPLPPAVLSTPLPSSRFFAPSGMDSPIFESALKEREKETTRPKSRARLETPQVVPVLANTKSKVKRPSSMQIGTSPSRSTYHAYTRLHQPLASPPDRIGNSRPISGTPTPTSPTPSKGSISSTPPSTLSLISPSLARVKEQGSIKNVVNRRSMPTLVNGPPPAPPPDCALPPLPPPGSAGTRSSIGSRDSLRVIS